MTIQKYDRLSGVPHGYYYLVKITTFGDFEVSQEEKILFVAEKKDELLNYCRNNNIKLDSSWCGYYISQHI